MSIQIPSPCAHLPGRSSVPYCGSDLDRWGDRAVQCRVGMGVANTHRLDAVRECLSHFGNVLDMSVRQEPPLSVQVVGREARRPDLGILDRDHGGNCYIDVMGTSPLALSYLGALSPVGQLLVPLLVRQLQTGLYWMQTPRVVCRPFCCTMRLTISSLRW